MQSLLAIGNNIIIPPLLQGKEEKSHGPCYKTPLPGKDVFKSFHNDESVVWNLKHICL